MAQIADVAYHYDGTLEGMLCCVFESYRRDEMPAFIFPYDAAQASLFPVLAVRTSAEKARRVSIAIHKKICPDALVLTRLAFLTCLEDKELHILRFLRLGFERGARAVNMVADSRVDVLRKAVGHMTKEQHLYKGFVRFSDIGGVLFSEIEPKNFVLPLMAAHFAGRFSGESFMIYDRTHKVALLYSHGRKELVKLDSFTMPAAAHDERQYRALWKRFYDTIAVEGRENPRCRMSLMPKRYWGTMTEFIERGEPRASELAALPTLPDGR